MTAVLLAVVVVVVTAVLDDRRRVEMAPLRARLERELAGLHVRWARPAAVVIRRRVALRRADFPITWHVAPWPRPDPGWSSAA